MKRLLTEEQIEACRRIGRDAKTNTTVIGLRELDVLCDAALLAISGQRLADAVQKFRNVPMLGRHTKLRATDEYEELCEAWREWRDKTNPLPDEDA